jgi:hypothetical protein
VQARQLLAALMPKPRRWPSGRPVQILVETVWFTRTLTASPTIWHRQRHSHKPLMAKAVWRQLARWPRPLSGQPWNRLAVDAIDPAAMPFLSPQYLAT